MFVHPISIPTHSIQPILSNIKSIYGPSVCDYSSQESRLKSFVYAPRHLYRMKNNLVKSGFHYTGSGNLVKCCLCFCEVEIDYSSSSDKNECLALEVGLKATSIQRYKLLIDLPKFSQSKRLALKDDLDKKHNPNCKFYSNPIKSNDQKESKKDLKIAIKNDSLGGRCDQVDDENDLITRTSILSVINQMEIENKKLKDMWICMKCEIKEVDTLFLPCRHLVCCESCSDSLSHCLYCYEKISATVRVFRE